MCPMFPTRSLLDLIRYMNVIKGLGHEKGISNLIILFEYCNLIDSKDYQQGMILFHNFVALLKHQCRPSRHFPRGYQPFLFLLVLLRHMFYCRWPMCPMLPIHMRLCKITNIIEIIFFSKINQL